MNSVTIMGRLGRDPETRVTTGGQKVTTFSVATSVYRSGQEETIWFRVTVWGDRFDKILQYMSKGKAVVVVGQLSRAPEIWNDNSGQARVSSLEITADSIHFSPFGTKNEDQEQGSNAGYGQGVPQQTQSRGGYSQPTYGGQASTEQQNPQSTYNTPQTPPPSTPPSTDAFASQPSFAPPPQTPQQSFGAPEPQHQNPQQGTSFGYGSSESEGDPLPF